MARAAIKKRAAKVGLNLDNAPPLGTRKPISVMVEPGQDAEAKAYPADGSRKGRQAKKDSPGIITSGKGRSGA